ncbi:MAG TPA: class I SAM-dependent rRNA methyltransferase [Polyangiaceae bacterium]|nr:class I SAM-dependent rRNA methyltransferase [Polyangiaceae bacterium]
MTQSRAGLVSLLLPENLGEQLSLGHPWIYRNHLPSDLSLPNGSWVHLRSGKAEGYALWDQSSPIALRLFSRRQVPDSGWFRARIADAVALRAPLRAASTTAYRLLYGEGDGIPGLTLDIYDRYAVVVTYADSVDTLVPAVLRAVREQVALDGILQRRRAPSDGNERAVLLEGREPPRPLLVTEYGVRFVADLYAGQKTGLFLDHRENRVYVRGQAQGRSVLNLFAYTGGFSLLAALGGARSVTSVDIAPAAIAAAVENFRQNDLPAALHEGVVSDVFDYLEAAREQGRRFDLIVCDPPSFASSQSKQFAALRAYARLNALGLSLVEPGGLYAAASCTAQVSPEAFRLTLAQAAARAGVRLQIVHDVGQPADHPVFVGHPEGRYLKFVVARVLGPV